MNAPLCEAECLNGKIKGFDLSGYFIKSGVPVVVEVKNVTTDSNLRDQFWEFLAVAYSSTAKRLEPGPTGKPKRPDDQREFMWVSWHPFGPLSRWTQLDSPSEIRMALNKYPDLLDGQQPDEDLLRLVAGRIWVLTFNPKQKSLSLKPKELRKAHAVLNRKAPSL